MIVVWPASPLGLVLATLDPGGDLPKPGHPDSAFGLVIWQIVGYPAEETRQAKGWNALIARIGLDPKAILAASDETLQAITRQGGSIAVALRADRLRDTARRVLNDYGGDLDQVLNWPDAKARKALTSFPMIGAPIADKILLFCGGAARLAPDSNALRVLVRTGLIEAEGGYSKLYRAANALAAQELGGDIKLLQRTHLILRRHGLTDCKRNGPNHANCPLASDCQDRCTANG